MHLLILVYTKISSLPSRNHLESQPIVHCLRKKRIANAKKMWLNFSTQNEPMNRTYAYDKVNMSSYQMIDNACSIDDVDLSEQGLCKWLHSLFLLDFMLVASSFHFYFHQLIILGMLRKRRNFWVAAQYIL